MTISRESASLNISPQFNGSASSSSLAKTEGLPSLQQARQVTSLQSNIGKTPVSTSKKEDPAQDCCNSAALLKGLSLAKEPPKTEQQKGTNIISEVDQLLIEIDKLRENRTLPQESKNKTSNADEHSTEINDHSEKLENPSVKDEKRLSGSPKGIDSPEKNHHSPAGPEAAAIPAAQAAPAAQAFVTLAPLSAASPAANKYDLKSNPTQTDILGNAAKRTILSIAGAVVRIPMGLARVAVTPAIALAGIGLLVAGLVNKSMGLEGIKALKFAGQEAVFGTSQSLTSVVEVVLAPISLIIDPILGKEAVRTASLDLENIIIRSQFKSAKLAMSVDQDRNPGKNYQKFTRILNIITLLNPNMGTKQKSSDVKGPSQEYIRAAQHVFSKTV